MSAARVDRSMMDEEDAVKTLTSIQTARKHAVCGQHGAATALLMQALQGVPQLAEELEAELTFSLKVYGDDLVATGKPNNALWLYSQVIPLLPRPRGLHTNLGSLHYSLGNPTASIESFQRALALDPGYWPALESLENVKSLAVDRWHFRMLNHSARNEAYARAIQRAVTSAAASHRSRGSQAGVTVLDIGTGTGILAVMAARAGASCVYACEVNGVLCAIAREVLERNGVADRVTIIQKSSGALVPGVDIPKCGVDVIVTELVDSGLLGERIIPVLADARARGLLAESGRVIPEGARVYAAVLQSDPVRRRSRLLPGCPVGLSSSSVRPTIEEPYTCEDLRRLDHRLLTSPTAVLDVDFLRDGAVLMACPTPAPTHVSRKSMTNGHHSWQHDDLQRQQRQQQQQQQQREPYHPVQALPVIRTGRADAIAVWFDLWLDGERAAEDVVSTRPQRRTSGDASGWDAGIYFASGISLQEGGEVALRARAGRDKLHFALNGQEGVTDDVSLSPMVVDDHTNGRAAKGIRTHADGGGTSANCERALVGEMDLARLNDTAFHVAHANAVAKALMGRGEDIGSFPPTCPLSHFASTALRNFRSTSSSASSSVSSVASITSSSNNTAFFHAPSPHSATPASDTFAASAAAGSAATVGLSPKFSPSSLPPPAFVLDLCGAWGLAGLLVAQLDRRDGTPATRVLAVAEDREAAHTMNTLARENSIGPDRYLATPDRLIDLASRGTMDDGVRDETFDGDATMTKHCFDWPGLENSSSGGGGGKNGQEAKWSAVMASSLVEGSGLLKQGGLGDLELCRRFVGRNCAASPSKMDVDKRRRGRVNDTDATGPSDADAVAFVPGSLEVVCQGLQRASLLAENGVESSCCCGVDVDPVNAFGVVNFRELDLSAAAATSPHGESPRDRPRRSRSDSCSGNDMSNGMSSGRGSFGATLGGVNETRKLTSYVHHIGGIRQNKHDEQKQLQDDEEADHEEEEEEAFLTAPVVCYALDLANVRAAPDGCLRRRSTRLHVQRDGTLHALAYWYRQRLGPAAATVTVGVGRGGLGHESAFAAGATAAVLDTGPCSSTGGAAAGDETCSSSHLRQAAVLLKEPVKVTTGQCIDLSMYCNTSGGVVVHVLGIVDVGMGVN